jgi:endo-beta-N-acetylglucosaminidase D
MKNITLEAGDRIAVLVKDEGQDAGTMLKARVQSFEADMGLVFFTTSKTSEVRSAPVAEVFPLYRYVQTSDGERILPLMLVTNEAWQGK